MRRLLLALSIAGMATGCGSDNDSNGNFHSPDVELNEVSVAGCIDVQKYFQILRSMPPATPARLLTTDFEATALKDNFVSAHFRKRSAYQNFLLEDTAITRVSELRPVVQTDCERVTDMAGAAATEYQVIAKGPDFIALENEFQEKFTYQWLSSTSMRIVHEYLNGDLNCHDKSKAMLKVTRELTWGDRAEARRSTLPHGKISDRFISLMTQATGFPKSELYDSGSPVADEIPASPPPDPEPGQPIEPEEPPFHPGDGAGISIPKLREMLALPLKPEFLHCD